MEIISLQRVTRAMEILSTRWKKDRRMRQWRCPRKLDVAVAVAPGALARDLHFSCSDCRNEEGTMQEKNPAASAAQEIKSAARDALRVGSQWAHTALQWVDERSQQMNNRNREQEQRERAERNRHPASSHGSDEGDYGYANSQEASSLYGGRRGQQHDRDVQGDYSTDDSSARQQGYGREGSYPQSRYAQSPQSGQARSGRDGAGHLGTSAYERTRSARGQAGSAPDRGPQSEGGRDYGYGGSGEIDDQDFSSDYSQGSSHYGSQGFGAQGSQGVFGPQGFGAQGGSSAPQDYGSGRGGFSREGYGSRDYAQGDRAQQERSGQWRASDVTGQGFGRSTGNSYRGLGPKNYTRSDERIREDLNERLTDADDIDASGISVEVSNGVATLSGTVDQRWMKHRAEDIADACSGVRDVNNQIRLRSASQDSGQQFGSQGGGSAPQASGTNASQSPGDSGPPGRSSGAGAGSFNASASGGAAQSGASASQGQSGSSGSSGHGAPGHSSGNPGSSPR